MAPSFLGAQHLTLRNFDRHVYKAGTQNWSIAQGSDGRMLFGNALGLLTFDGGQWNIYPIRVCTGWIRFDCKFIRNRTRFRYAARK